MKTMLGSLKMCYACLEINTQELIDVSTIDYDNVSFLYKLQMCVSTVLEESNSKLLCPTCIQQLRTSYKFRDMVLVSQDVLLKRKNELNLDRCQDSFESKLVLNSQFFDPECLRVKDDATELTYRNGDDEYCFSNNSKIECTQCKEKIWNINEHVCKEYFSEEDTKELKLMRRRGILKKAKICEFNTEYECYHCSTVFNKRWKLQKHISRVHTDIKKYVCTYCGKAFKQSYHLREHLTSHTGERKYTCAVCNKTFQRISSMKRHFRSHERAPGEKTKKTPFLCTVCGKNFPFSNGVQRHMRIHLGIKNHECSICQRRFTQSTHLHVHMRTHTGEKPYICDSCGEAFSVNAGLQKHMTIHKSSSDKATSPEKTELI
ncbi:hypothetical protein FQR65_LT02562 [Abscondita terminalis]|nr:hypothetical protein FQR65_LT02562 [Abscondita terminalis]